MKVLGLDLDKLWWNISSGLMEIVDWLGKAFNFLVGADTIDASANQGQGDNISNLFVTIFNGNKGTANMTKLYLGIMLGCIAFLCIFVAIGAVKAQFTKGATDSLQNIGVKSLFAIVKMVAIPVVFFIALQAMGVIFQFLIGVMSQGSNSSSLAQSLCEACYTGTGDIAFNMDYDELSRLVETGGEFNYLLCILASAFLVVTLVTVSITLTKRIIEVFFYYLSAPIAICRTPLDDGKSFELWKENVVSKLLSAGGIIICMYLFYAIIPLFNGAVTTWQAADVTGKRDVLANVLKILFVIGGSCVPASASMLMAQLISQGAGQNESNNMMHTQQMMGNATRLATAVGSHGLLGALGGGGKAGAALTKGVGGGVSNLLSGAFGLGSGGSGGGASAMTNGAVAGGIANAAARTGAAAMAAFSGNGGGASPSAAPGGSSGGSSASRVASGTSVKSGGGFFSNVKNNAISAWKGAGSKIANTSPFLGVAGKAGALLGAGIRGLAGTVMAAPKAAVQSLKGKIGSTKPFRHLSNKMQERRDARRIKSQGRLEEKASKRTTGKYSNLDRAMELDRQNGGKSNTSEYMLQKMSNYQARADKVEAFLDKKSGWSDERKQEYRRSQLGNEANRISAYADAAHGSMNEQSIARFKGFYDRMSRDLYGDKGAAGGDDNK